MKTTKEIMGLATELACEIRPVIHELVDSNNPERGLTITIRSLENAVRIVMSRVLTEIDICEFLLDRKAYHQEQLGSLMRLIDIYNDSPSRTYEHTVESINYHMQEGKKHIGAMDEIDLLMKTLGYHE